MAKRPPEKWKEVSARVSDSAYSSLSTELPSVDRRMQPDKKSHLSAIRIKLWIQYLYNYIWHKVLWFQYHSNCVEKKRSLFQLKVKIHLESFKDHSTTLLNQRTWVIIRTYASFYEVSDRAES